MSAVRADICTCARTVFALSHIQALNFVLETLLILLMFPVQNSLPMSHVLPAQNSVPMSHVPFSKACAFASTLLQSEFGSLPCPLSLRSGWL